MATSPSNRHETEAIRLLDLIRQKSSGDRRQFERILADAAGRLIRRGTTESVTTAVHLMNRAGFTVDTNSAGEFIGRRLRGTDASGGSGSGNSTMQGAASGQPRSTRRGGRMYDETWSRGSHESGTAELQNETIYVLQSSNVYSFAYVRHPGQALGTLYVTFKAHQVNPQSITAAANKSGWRDMKGRLGKTVGGKIDAPGATYAYYRVPPGVFTQMKAANSAGKFVWDKLRVRGTIHGHQYGYGLVRGQITDTKYGNLYYIPRKAGKDGFKARAKADQTQREGRRGFNTSTLPAQSYSYRSRDRR